VLLAPVKQSQYRERVQSKALEEFRYIQLLADGFVSCSQQELVLAHLSAVAAGQLLDNGTILELFERRELPLRRLLNRGSRRRTLSFLRLLMHSENIAEQLCLHLVSYDWGDQESADVSEAVEKTANVAEPLQ